MKANAARAWYIQACVPSSHSGGQAKMAAGFAWIDARFFAVQGLRSSRRPVRRRR